MRAAKLIVIVACALLSCIGCGDLSLGTSSNKSSTSAPQQNGADGRKTYAALSCHLLNLDGQTPAERVRRGLIVRAWGVDFYLQGSERAVRVIGVISWDDHVWEARETDLVDVENEGTWRWDSREDPESRDAPISPPGGGRYKVNVEVYNQANNSRLGSAEGSCEL